MKLKAPFLKNIKAEVGILPFLNSGIGILVKAEAYYQKSML